MTTDPFDLALSALRRAALDVDRLSTAATRLADDTAWSSNAADRYRSAVGDLIDDIRRLAGSVAGLESDVRSDAARWAVIR
jgi:hypothetical protein